MAETNEQRLIRLAQAGNTAAFEALVHTHAQLVYNLALRTLGDPHEAEDVAQEVFVRAWRSLPAFRAESALSTWLYRIVTNLCYNRLPGLKQNLAALDPDEEVELPDERQEVEGVFISAELKQSLQTAVSHLPHSYRLLITLRHIQNLSYAEIAEITNLPLGTVKTGIHRARQLLREALKQYEQPKLA